MAKRYHSGLKQGRQNKVRYEKNKAEKSFIRITVKKCLMAFGIGKNQPAAPKAQAVAALSATFSALDKGAKHGLLHKNTVARKKSRMAKKLAKMKAV